MNRASRIAIGLLVPLALAAAYLVSREAPPSSGPAPERGAPPAEASSPLHVRGTVLPPQGETLPQGCILEARSGAKIATWPVDADGGFLWTLASGRWQVRARAGSDLASEWRSVSPETGSLPRVQLQLRPLRQVQGRVVDKQGKALADFGVVLVRDDPAAARPAPGTDPSAPLLSRSAPDGSFHFLDLGEGRVWLHAGTPNRAAGPVIAVESATSGESVVHDVLADEVGALHLRIVTAIGAPVPAADVRLVSMGNGASERRARTDYGGKLEFEDLPCGQWSLTADSPRGAVVEHAVEVVPGVQELQLAVEQGRGPRQRASRVK